MPLQSLLGDELRLRVFRWLHAYGKMRRFRTDTELAKDLGIEKPYVSMYLSYERYMARKGRLPSLGLDHFVKICQGMGRSLDVVAGSEPDFGAEEPRERRPPGEASAENAAPRRRKGGTPGGGM